MPNRLALEDSPYLQQHKNNPVDWYPWCDEAFEHAKEGNKAIFISIGYSSCHWCHVMEREVFENEKIAAFLNEHFISIKVDREERPDIDKHYQEVHLLLNRTAGGWPTSIIATPDNRPFYAGTYIPPYQRDQRMGFDELIRIVAKRVELGDEKMFEVAAEVQGWLEHHEHPTQATKLHESIARTFIKQAEYNYESIHGGFSPQIKFPHVSTLNALLNCALILKDDTATSMVEHSLRCMQRGGMYDLIEGGFCRYSTDCAWLVPHFEKMAYDNGLLCELYTKASVHFKDAAFLRTAKEIADFMLEKMCEDSLFYSASDADSEGGEGTYFTYGYDEVYSELLQDGLSADEAAEILRTLHITREGNFEGRSVVWLESSLRPEWFGRVQKVLKAIRDNRPYPFIDKKVQVSWNAMMIKALFRLARHDDSYRQKAETSLDALLRTMFINEKLYHSALISKAPKINAFLEDYAYLGTALIAAYETTYDDLHLIKAQQLANKALELFYENGRWYFSKGEFVTDAEITDSTYPGTVGVMVDLLLSLGALGEGKYRRFAFKTLEYHSFKMAKAPIQYPFLFDQSLRYLKGDRIIKAGQSALSDALAELLQIGYPYTSVYADASASGYMVCGNESCFASTHNPAELDSLVRGTL